MLNFHYDIEQSLSVLKKGGLLLYPTDTIWGIGCDATNESAVAKIYKLKNRVDSKAMIVLVTKKQDVLKHVAALDLAVFDYLNETKKPTTVIYQNAIGFAENLLAEDSSIGIRICKDDFCRQLIKRFRKPIVSTSANISGNNSPQNFDGIDLQIRNGVDYIVKHRQDEKIIALPSSIIKWENGKVQILRY